MKAQTDFKELAARVMDLAKKAGANDCKVNLSRNRFVEINYRNRKPEVIKEATTQSLYLEVFVDSRYAGQSTPDFRPTTLQGFVQDLVDNARIMEQDPFRTLPDPKYFAGRSTADLQLSDPAYGTLTPENRHDMAKAVEAACLDKGGDKVISVEADTYDETWQDYMATSNGFEGSSEGTIFQVGASMTAKDEGDRRPNGYHNVVCRFKNDLPSLTDVGNKAAMRTLDLMGGKKIGTETLPVIIENRGAGRVLNGFMSALYGSNLQQKRSFLADKKGQKVASDKLTLIDDPFLIRGLGSKYFDGDGFPARKREIMSQGTVNDFLIDWYYSRKLNTEPTTGSVSNLLIPPGTRSVNEIIKDLGRCVVITDFIGGNSNSTTGDFSVGVIGKLFDKGEFVQNIAEMNMAGNHLQFWNQLIETGNDPWMYSSWRLPSLVFDKVVVAGI
jgi:PmbA protein